MSTRENASGKKVVDHLPAAVYTTTQTPTNGVSTKGFDAVTALISVGTITNVANSPQPSWAFKAQESDTINASFVDIKDSERIAIIASKSPVAAPDSSTGVFLTVDAADEDAETYHVGITSDKEYVRIVSTAANTPGNTPLSIVMELERADRTPVSN